MKKALLIVFLTEVHETLLEVGESHKIERLTALADKVNSLLMLLKMP